MDTATGVQGSTETDQKTDVSDAGTFVVDDSSLTQENLEDPLHKQDTLDERLHKVTSVASLDGLNTEKEIVALDQHNKESGSEGATSPSKAVKESSLPQTTTNMQQVSEVAPQTETHEEYHTVSGGPETIKELSKKNVATILGTGMVYSTMGVPSSKEKDMSPPAQEQKSASLGGLLFIVLIFVDFIFFVFSLASPILIEYGVNKKYLFILENGMYSNGQFMFSKTLPDDALQLTVLMTGLSLVVVFIGGIIDAMTHETTKMIGKLFIFIVTLGVIGAVIYFFVTHGLNVGTLLKAMFPSVKL